MKNKIAEWTVFFDRMFREVKKIIYERNKLEKDGSGPPEILAVRNTVSKFPSPVRVAEIRIDKEKHGHIEDDVCQIVRYDFSKLGAILGTVKYYGIVDAKDSETLRRLLIRDFDLNYDAFDDFYKDFRMTGWCNDEISFFTQFPLYNIKDNFRKFVSDFLSFGFSFLADKIRLEFRKGIDWNSKFNLESDPILPMAEVTKMDKILNAFVPFTEGAGIERLQKDICCIQLIPSVPEDVKKVFRHAKDLHIYGFFRYNFFAIAQHYAYLALESAIKNRYYQSFGKEVTLRNKKGETVKMGKVDHQTVIDFCHVRRGWDVHNLKIDGEKFAFSSKELIAWLVRKKIITMWEGRKCERGMDLRNRMSHLTRAYIFPPGYSRQALEFVADVINRIYSAATYLTNNNSKNVFPLDVSP